jgi:hypothetical protein
VLVSNLQNPPPPPIMQGIIPDPDDPDDRGGGDAYDWFCCEVGYLSLLGCGV